MAGCSAPESGVVGDADAAGDPPTTSTADNGNPDRPLVSGQIPAAATADYFLKISGVDGESNASGHSGELDILAWSWGAAAADADGAASTRTSGAVMPDELWVVRKAGGEASPALYEALTAGMSLRSASLALVLDGVEQRWTFTDLRVTSYHLTGKGDAAVEEVTFSYEAVTFA